MANFKQAIRRAKKARCLFSGPPGSGKTATALLALRGMVGPEGSIAVIDSEHGSASMYAELNPEDDPTLCAIGKFDTIELASHSPEDYVEAVGLAASGGYDALAIDSASHEWVGTGGILEIVDKVGGGDKFGKGWRTATPKHNTFINAILAAPMHVVCTVRSKVGYEMVKAPDGRSEVRRLGMQMIQREGFDYEFDVVGDIDNGVLTVLKTRIPFLRGVQIDRAGLQFGESVAAYLSQGQGWKAPEMPKMFKVGGKEIVTAGLSAEQYTNLVELGRRIDTIKPATATVLLIDSTGKAKLTSLTAAEGVKAEEAFEEALACLEKEAS